MEKKIIRSSVLLGSVLMLLAACKNTESDIGSEFFQSHSQTRTIDTLTVQVSTVFLDSLSTAGTQTLLAGTHDDTLSGHQEVISFQQLASPTLKSITDDVIFDSLCFMLKPNQYYWGDTTSAIHLSVHQLSETLDPGTQTTFYNTSSFAYNPDPLGEWSGRIYPHLTDSVSIRLSDSLGQSFFDMIRRAGLEVSDNAHFIDYFKGICLKSDTRDKVVYGFYTGDSSAYMRLYYHEQQDQKNLLHLDFPFVNPNLQFNQVKTDRSGTPFEALNTEQKILPMSQTENVALLNPLGNMAIRLDFPYLQKLLLLGSYGKIIQAQLTLTPAAGSNAVDQTLPPSLPMCVIRDYYTVEDSLINSVGQVATGNLVSDPLYGRTYYTYDMVPYLSNEIQKTDNNTKRSLLITLPQPAFNTTFQRLMLNNPEKAIQLKIEFLTYTE